MTEHYPRLSEVLKSLKNNADKANAFEDGSANWLIEKHKKWDNLISGVALGYHLEADKALKYVTKLRPVDATRGDITTTSDRFKNEDVGKGKVVQLKHTLCRTSGAVDTALAKALKQLAGVAKEKPLPGDRLVAEIVISDPKNSWPLTEAKGKTWIAQTWAYPLALFESALKLKVDNFRERGDFRPARKLVPGRNTYSDDFDFEDEEIVKKLKRAPSTVVSGDAMNEEGNTTPEVTAVPGSKMGLRHSTRDPDAFRPLSDRFSFAAASQLLIKINYIGGRKFYHSDGNFYMVSKVVCGVRYDYLLGLRCHILRLKGVNEERLLDDKPTQAIRPDAIETESLGSPE